MIQVLQLLLNQKNLELTRLDQQLNLAIARSGSDMHERIEAVVMDMAHVRLAIQEYTSLIAAHKEATETKNETKTETKDEGEEDGRPNE